MEPKPSHEALDPASLVDAEFITVIAWQRIAELGPEAPDKIATMWSSNEDARAIQNNLRFASFYAARKPSEEIESASPQEVDAGLDGFKFTCFIADAVAAECGLDVETIIKQIVKERPWNVSPDVARGDGVALANHITAKCQVLSEQNYTALAPEYRDIAQLHADNCYTRVEERVVFLRTFALMMPTIHEIIGTVLDRTAVDELDTILENK